MKTPKFQVGDKVRRNIGDNWAHGYDKIYTVNRCTASDELWLDEIVLCWDANYFHQVFVVNSKPTFSCNEPAPKHEHIGKTILLRFIKSYKEVLVVDVRDNGKAYKVRKLVNGSFEKDAHWTTVDNTERYEHHFICILP